MSDPGFPIFGDDRSAFRSAVGMHPPRDLVAITWDGSPPVHRLMHFDVAPNFDVLTIDYSGSATLTEPWAERHHFRSRKTEGKGQCFEIVSEFLETADTEYRYVGILDDDIVLRVSDLHYLLHIAQAFDLDSFAPSLSKDGFFSHSHTLTRDSRLFHRAPWVEVMMPFYRVDIFKMASPFFSLSISSWGIDKYVMPMFQHLTRRERTAVVDGIVASHVRPIRSAGTTYSNGLNAFEEMKLVREACISYINVNHPELIDTPWFAETFDTLRPAARIRRKFHSLLGALR